MGQTQISKTGSIILFLLLSLFSFAQTKPVILQSGYTVDIDGNAYGTIIVGSKIWFTENLKVTRFNDGTAILLNNSKDTARTSIWTNYTTPAYCWLYDDKSTMMANGYGALYNYFCVATGKLCPTGFHVPTKIEFDSLVKKLGGGNYAGGMLKTTTGWTINNGTDKIGFKALPAGDRYGSYQNVGNFTAWWSYDQFPSSSPYPYGFSYTFEIVDYYTWAWMSNFNQTIGASIRCVK